MKSKPRAEAIDLGALIQRVQQDDTLATTRRRDLASSLRSFARAVGRPLTAITSDVESLRAMIDDAQPANARLSPKRWANIRSDVAFAARRYGGQGRRQWQATQLTGVWEELRARIEDPWERIRLSRLFRYLDENGIAPEAVTAATLNDFEHWLRSETLARNPEATLKVLWRCWNKAVADVPGWPQVKGKEISRQDLYGLPREAFPLTFAADLEAWEAAASGADPLAERGPPRPLRPATVRHELRVILRFASALVHSGVPAGEIRSLADLVSPERFKLGLRYLLERRGGKPSPGTSQMADILITIARRWVGIDSHALDRLKRIAKRIDAHPTGLTQANRRRLTQFDDDRNVVLLLDLPKRLVDMAGYQDSKQAALLVQVALAVSILLAAPVRLRNIAELNLARHIIRSGRGRGGSARLVFEGEETKNREVLDFPLPSDTVEILDHYLDHHRPHLLNGPDAGWLFPGKDGNAKVKNLLSAQISKAIRRHTGLIVNTHLFRHLAGKLSLRVDPGNYEQVRRLLGHRSINTTTLFYTGFASEQAARRYHEMVLFNHKPRGNMAKRRGKVA